MKFLRLLFINMLLYTLYTGSAYSAPVSATSTFSGSKKLFENMPVGMDITMRFDHQKSILREQVNQFPYKEPDDGEVRHYSKVRSSENYSDLLELETGISLFDKAYIYAKGGIGSFHTDLYVLDERVKGLYKKPDLYKITDNSLIMYGFGFSLNIHEQEVKKFFKKINGQIDVQYRKFFADVKNYGQKDISYNVDLDEIQVSLLCIGSFENKSVFFGPRISNITGGERLHVKSEKLYFEESIKTSENMGWVLGINFFDHEFYSLTLQMRTGDEEGISFGTKIKF